MAHRQRLGFSDAGNKVVVCEAHDHVKGEASLAAAIVQVILAKALRNVSLWSFFIAARETIKREPSKE